MTLPHILIEAFFVVAIFVSLFVIGRDLAASWGAFLDALGDGE